MKTQLDSPIVQDLSVGIVPLVGKDKPISNNSNN